MKSERPYRRRRFLAAVSVGIGATAAGCLGTEPERQATVFIAPPEDRLELFLQEREAILDQAADAESIAVEPTEQIRQLEEEMLNELMDTVTEYIESRELTIDDTHSNRVLLVTGPVNDLFDLLQLEEVDRLQPAAEFEASRPPEPQSNSDSATSEESQPNGSENQDGS